MPFVLDHVGEWTTPNWHTLKIPLVLFLVTLLAGFALQARIQGARLVSLFLLTILALSYLRGLIMFFLIAPLILVKPLSKSCSWLGGDIKRRVAEDDPVLAFIGQRAKTVLACAMAAVVVSLAMRWGELNTPTPSPVAAIDFVEKTGISGNVFNSPNFGPYLIWRGIPDFIDSRSPPLTDSFVKQAYDTERAVDIESSIKTLDDYRVTWVLLNPWSPLGKVLPRLGGWELKYSDQMALVYARK
jgi:hypothetical protein